MLAIKGKLRIENENLFFHATHNSCTQFWPSSHRIRRGTLTFLLSCSIPFCVHFDVVYTAKIKTQLGFTFGLHKSCNHREDTKWPNQFRTIYCVSCFFRIYLVDNGQILEDLVFICPRCYGSKLTSRWIITFSPPPKPGTVNFSAQKPPPKNGPIIFRIEIFDKLRGQCKREIGGNRILVENLRDRHTVIAYRPTNKLKRNS